MTDLTVEDVLCPGESGNRRESPETISRFRQARGQLLASKIQALRIQRGRDVRVLDLGGRADYWQNIGITGIDRIVLVNSDAGEFDRPAASGIFENRTGDARDLTGYDDRSFDLVHSNSVIEHVGLWPDMSRMAAECQRVGAAGWVQTPAWEFPIEPHYRLPCAHWFGQPARRAMLRLSRHYRHVPLAERRFHVDRINLLSHAEFEALFPRARIWIERFLLWPKSYVAHW